ncbi:MAG: hypothetical protein SNI70_11190, partial [Rikenellaceae bacterium]
MPKAKRYKGVRATKAAPQSKHRRKEDGRPKGTLKKFKFEETRLGFMLKYEIPALYEVIMRMTPKSQYPEPKVKIIEMVCRVSSDPSLSKAKFARYL